MTDTIIVRGLEKTFRVKTKKKGFKGSLESLFKPEYKQIDAVKNVSFSIPKGQLVGFIGPNGAGKSTTIKILTGILHPNRGSARVLGMVPWEERKELTKRLGTVFGQRSQLWLHLPPQDSFDLFAAIYEIEKDTYRKRLAALVKEFEIKDLLDQPVRKLSLGQRMRCELVAALLHEPEVLYLDEPSIGLDIVAKKQLREHIRKINKQGVTVLLTSHDMSDIEDLCERVLIINHGRLIHDSSFEQLRKQYLHRKRISVYLNSPSPKIKLVGVETRKHTDEVVELDIDLRKTQIQKVLLSVTTKMDIDDIDVHDPPIEQIIEEIFSEKK